jgi:HAD superfamily hydrolase (TIGR01509 family)
MPADMLTILDCDGVLIDSEIIASQAMAKALSRAGFPISEEELNQRFAGMTDDQIFKILEEENNKAIPEDFAEKLSEDIDEDLAGVKPIAGVEEMLDSLDGPFCVCSNSRMNRLRISLNAVGLFDRLMPNIFSAPEVGSKEPKPSPAVYLFAAKEMGFAPEDTVVVEDSVAGVTGAVAAGMRVIGFIGASHNGVGKGEQLMEAGAQTVVRRLSEVPAVLAALKDWHGIPG